MRLRDRGAKRPPAPMHTRSSFEGNAQRDRYDARTPMSFRIPEEDLRPQRPGGPKRVARRVGTLVALVAAVAVIAVIIGLVVSLRSHGTVSSSTKVTITIPTDASGQEVAKLLHDNGLIGNELLFRARLRASGDNTGIVAGQHTLTGHMTYKDIVKALSQSPPAAPTYKIVFPEGLRITQIAATIDRMRVATASSGKTEPAFTGAQYLAAIAKTPVPTGFGVPKGNTNLEGFLFPATYQLRITATAQDLISQQLTAFRTNFGTLNLTYAKSKNLTPYDVLNIASMVEREAKLPADRPKISAVIYNRLHSNTPLGVDPVIQYATSKTGYTADLTESDLQIDSPYNDRTHTGLPPTPITNPGLASMQAAATPSKVPYVYYEAKTDGSGGQFFTTSYQAFLDYQTEHPAQTTSTGN